LQPSALHLPEALWVDNNQQLAELCSQWQQEAFVAMDTEFVRTRTFYPRTGLIQLADSQGCYLIDPLAIDDWSAFKALLQNEAVVKVFHSPAEDLEVCLNLVGAIPTPMRDSQLAAALASMGGIMGFQRLVKEVLDIELDKGETRSNWLARPLTSEQIDYAVADVHFLYQIYPKLVDKLESMGRADWWHEDCQRVTDEYPLEDDFSQAFRKVKLAWKLRDQEQCILQHLTIWREHTAREMDVPRNQVLNDQALWNLARYKPYHFDGVKKSGVTHHILKNHYKTLISIIKDAQKLEQDEWPAAIERPLTPQQGEIYKKLKKLVTAKAEMIDIPADLLVKKKPLEALLRSYWKNDLKLPEVLSGWRQTEITNDLVQSLD